jgi:hypothetical protein
MLHNLISHSSYFTFFFWEGFISPYLSSSIDYLYNYVKFIRSKFEVLPRWHYCVCHITYFSQVLWTRSWLPACQISQDYIQRMLIIGNKLRTV